MQAILKIRMLGVWGALLAVLAAGMVLPSAQAQSSNPNQKSANKASGSSQAQPPSESSEATEKESAPANKERAGGPQEGIKVHGHWVIDVRNPDGKLVSHREFENGYGGGTLPAFLARHYGVGYWSVSLQTAGGSYFNIGEPGDPDPAFISQNLTISTASTSTANSFVLSGSFTAPANATVTVASTSVCICPFGGPVCNGNGQRIGFTSTNQSGQSFVAGQIVQVTVTITFS